MARTRGESKPNIKVIPAKTIYLYQISEEQIKKLSEGGGELELTFATFCLSCALTLIVTLFTCSMNVYLKIFFGVVTFAAGIFGLYFWICWLNKHNEVNKLKQDILDKKNEIAEEQTR